MRFKILTLGCKVNQYETQWLRAAFLANGWEEADDETDSVDLAIVNTCSVTAESDAKSRKTIAHCAKIYPSAELVVVGCYAASATKKVESLPRVSAVVPDKRSLADFLRKLGLTNIPSGVTGLADRQRAYVKVQDGCRVGCAYCVIPTTRPYLQSRPIDDVVEEARTLAANAYREIVLTGIHLGHYGLDFCPPTPEEQARLNAGEEAPDSGWNAKRLTLDDYLARQALTPPEQRVGLADLLRALTDLNLPKMRFRLGSLEAVEVSDAMLDVFEERPDALCPHFHLSMQSGDDSVLARMKRRWLSRPYIEKCREIRARIKDAALTTDVIVGFPGETDTNFERTCDVVRELRFSKVHVFRFSARPDTVAATLPDPVPEQVKKERAQTLIKIAREEREAFAKQFVGRTARVVVEDVYRKDDGELVAKGTTDRYYEAEIPLHDCAWGIDVAPGDVLTVRLCSLNGDVFRACD
ncbi:MAG: radical SAM protein [Thermoguttaceae bacterium]|nr:radical SAM protein [Thermoguttaceae bacterium]